MSVWLIPVTRSWLHALCLLLLLPPGITAADSATKLDIQATLGFAGTFRLGYWAPLTVTVSNNGADLLGELDVELTYGEELAGDVFTKTHRRSLDLSRGSRKRFRFTVFLETFAHPLVIRISSGGRELARHRIDLRRKFTEGRLILVLSRDANLDYLNDPVGESLRVLYPHPELLPRHWRGYDGVSAVVIHGISLENLSARQFDALKKWIAQGGKLAVAGGPDFSLLRTPRLAELLPASPTGLVRISDASALSLAFGEPLEAKTPFYIHRLVVTRGHVLYRAGDLPLVVEASNGRGSVSYFSFDVSGYPFKRWTGMKDLWFAILRISPLERHSFERRELRAESVIPSIVNRKGGFPDHITVIVFLVLYLGILATVYRLKPVSRVGRSLLPGLILACPLLFAPAAYYLFGSLLFRVGATVVITSIIEPLPHSPYARLSLDAGMFSNRRQRLRFEIERAEPIFIASRREERWGKTVSFGIDEDSGGSVEIDNDRPYVLHLMQGEDVIAYDINASAARTDSGIRLTLRNNTGQSWPEAWLVFGQSIYRLGEIAHNDGSQFTLHANTIHSELEGDLTPGAFRDSTGLGEFEQHMVQILLERALSKQLESGPLNPDEALLVAVVPSPIHLAQASASWQREELALVMFRIEVATASGA